MACNIFEGWQLFKFGGGNKTECVGPCCRTLCWYSTIDTVCCDAGLRLWVSVKQQSMQLVAFCPEQILTRALVAPRIAVPSRPPVTHDVRRGLTEELHEFSVILFG